MAFALKSKPPAQRPWRPDFRNPETLPDTKAIRTGFLINFVAIVIAVVVLSAYGFREYSLLAMTRMVSELEQKVAQSTARNRSLLEANKRFKQSAAIMEEAIAFDQQALDYARFISELAAAMPSGMLLSSIEMAQSPERLRSATIPPFDVQIAGRVFGSPRETPSQILTGFQDAIRRLACLEGRELKTELTRFVRNNEFGYFDFTLLVRIASAVPPAP